MTKRAVLGNGAAAGLALTVLMTGQMAVGEATGQNGRGDVQYPYVVLAQSNLPANAQVSRDTAAQRGPVTNLPVPRYVSLKGSEGNARRGPSLSHRIDWVFRHAGMPLRVVAEFGHWRRVEDKDGAGGWVHYALLSGVRTAVVTQDMAELRTRPDPESDVVARAESGAIVRLGECNPVWCEISGGGERGWVPKAALWGVDPDEIRE
ncbi:SH3 domain-containing protein [Paracoccus alkanivorans]|nr:SH3 domain-containing protein [Paracoccus alkanivorans]